MIQGDLSRRAGDLWFSVLRAKLRNQGLAGSRFLPAYVCSDSRFQTVRGNGLEPVPGPKLIMSLTLSETRVKPCREIDTLFIEILNDPCAIA
jgi:hypothetical protein